MKRILRSARIGVFVFLVLLALPASAITITWTNTAGGDWAAATNWSPNQVPVAADVAVINGSATYAIVVTGNRSVSGLVMDNPNATLRLLGQGGSGVSTLTVANGFENHGTIELTNQNSTSWAATLNVTAGALTNMASGTIRTFVGAGGNRTLGLELDNRGTLDIEQTVSLNKTAGKHRFAGTINLAAGASLNIGNSGTVEVTHAGANWTGTGTLGLPSSRPFNLETDFISGTIALDLQNAIIQGPGQFIVPANQTVVFFSTTINAPFQLLGTLENWASSSINGTFSVPSGALLRLLGRSGSGVSTLTVANGFENHGTIVLTNQDSASWQVILNVTAGALTNMASGTIRTFVGAGGNRTLGLELDNRGTLDIEQTVSLNKTAGKHRFAGTINLAAGASLNIGNSGTVEVTHAGANWTGTGTLGLPSSRPFILETDFISGTIALDLQNVTIQGPGQFIVPANQAVVFFGTTINVPFQLLGTLENWANSSINGTFTVPSGALLRLLGRSGSGVSTLTVANGFENHGTIELTNQNSASWATTLNVTAGALTNMASGTIRTFVGAGGNRTLGLELDNRGIMLLETSVTLNKSAAQHRNTGLIEVQAGEFTLTQSGASPTFSNAGELRVMTGATFRPTAGNWTNAPTGVLSGAGTFNLTAGTLSNLGTVSPGTSPGILGVTANYPQTSAALLALEIGGFTPGTEHDQLTISGTANLNGTVRAGLTNGFYPKKDDAFTVLTYASRNGSFSTVESAQPDRIAWRVDYTATNAQLVVENSAPTLATIANQSVNEQTLLSFTAIATDQDLPAQTLTYSLDTAPAGMTIGSGSGQFNWTPTEAQGPGVYPVTVRATDNGTPPLEHTNSFTVTVNEVNIAPQLTVPGPQSINELVELVFTISATDADLPANALTYQMLSGPTGATFNPATREFRWTPTEAQGPGISNAIFRVTDNNPNAVNTQQLSATNSVSITVNEVNVAPVLAIVPTATIHAGTTYQYTLSATDADLPANTLTYSLVSGPVGASVGAASGVVSWAAPLSAAGVTTNFTVRVTDNGVPPLPADRSFQVTVAGPVEITSYAREAGGFRVEWRTVPGLTYRLLADTNVAAGNWVGVGSDVSATGTSTNRLDATANTLSNRFYRVMLLP